MRCFQCMGTVEHQKALVISLCLLWFLMCFEHSNILWGHYQFFYRYDFRFFHSSIWYASLWNFNLRFCGMRIMRSHKQSSGGWKWYGLCQVSRGFLIFSMQRQGSFAALTIWLWHWHSFSSLGADQISWLCDIFNGRPGQCWPAWENRVDLSPTLHHHVV